MTDQFDCDQNSHQILNLLIEGNGYKAKELYEVALPNFSDQAQRWFETVFGLFVLSGELDISKNQFSDKSFGVDSENAAQALEAFCQNQDRQNIQLLVNKLSYNSPYKDFRVLLSTLLDIEDATDSLNKLDIIDRFSPYKPIADLIRLAWNSTNGVVDSSVLESSEQRFIKALQPQTTVGLEQQLSVQPSPQQLFTSLVEHPDTQKVDNYNAIMINLLIDYPAGLDAYQERFGTLTDFEQFRLKALANERSGDWQNAAELWHDCLQALEFESMPDSETAKQLIVERANQCIDQHGFFDPHDQTLMLEQRLENNPKDESTCLLLIEQYRSIADNQALKRILTQALDNFPEQPLIIAAAIEHATETVEFELAAQLARNLLDNDALNPDIRQLLILAYLSYADKLALRGQRYAAQTLFDQTETLERPESSGLVNLHRALMHYVTGEDLMAEQLVEKGCNQLDSYLIGYVQMAAETSRLGFKTKYKKKYIKLIKSLVSYQPRADEIVALILLLKGYSSDSRTDVEEFFAATRSLLHRSNSGIYSQEQISFICSTLEHMSKYEDLYQFILNLGQYSGQMNDEIEYYRIIGVTQGDPRQINTEDSLVLDQILDRLADKNPQLLDSIKSFLNANLSSGANDSESVITEGVSSGFQQHPDMKVGELLSTVKRLFNR